MEMLGRVRRMYFRDKLNRSEIARRTGLSRNTVKKWLKAEGQVTPAYQRSEVPRKLSPFEPWLIQALKADAQRPKKERRTGHALFVELKAQGYPGGFTAMGNFIREWRVQQGLGGALRAFVPLRFEMGEAFQFDWSSEGITIAGVWRKVELSHLKLCASRGFMLSAYPSQGHEMLFDAHTRAFTALGGIPRRGIYDNMKTAVDRVKKGKGRVVNACFSAMCSHYLFDPDFCNVASGWEKGVVEKNVQDSRRRIWLEATKLRFGSFDELNAWLRERCQALWHEIRHPEFDLTIAEMLELELPHLMPMVSPFDGYVEDSGRVSRTCLVAVLRNHYSVPCELAGRLIGKRIYCDRIDITCEDAVVASHRRQFDRGHVSYHWLHYIPLIERKPGALRNGAPFAEMPAPLIRLQRQLLRREGGDRIMSQVLAAVPHSGLEAVLVAVELVLETGLVSAEHVINMLARLTQAGSPASADEQIVPENLKINTAPKANTERYDSLREKEVVHE